MSNNGISDVIIGIGVVVFIILLVAGAIGAPIAFFTMTPADTDYLYEVKAQQMFDPGHPSVEETRNLSSLPPDQQRVMHEAFKATDHFMDGDASATVRYDTKKNVSEGLYPIEQNGVVMVVSVTEETNTWPDTSVRWVRWLGYYAIISWIIILVSFASA